MTTFFERAAHSVNRLLCFMSICIILVVSRFGFEGETLGGTLVLVIVYL